MRASQHWEPTVAIVIPCRNEEARIGPCLQSLSSLQYDHAKIETIVVDDGSEDATGKVASSYGAKVLDARGRGPSAARNLAIRNTNAELTAFTDADCVVHPLWLRRLVTALENPRYAGAGGAQEPFPGETPFGLLVHSFLSLMGFLGGYTKWGRESREVPHNATCNALYRTSVLREAGGFLEGMWPGEDVELDRRLILNGHSLLYVPDAVVYHKRPATWWSFARMMYRYGMSAGQLTRKYGIFRGLYAEPIGLLAALASFAMIAMADCRIALAAFVALLTAVLVWFKRKTGQSAVALCGLFSLTIAVWNSGFILGLVRSVPKRQGAGKQ